ncbi:MAG: lysine biosynthesis protein LysW [bacterium]|nr:lysine biosynthesis protein LysW [bacterium]
MEMVVSCPECDENLIIPVDAEEEEIIDCENCGVEIEIVSLDPLEIRIFEEEEK